MRTDFDCGGTNASNQQPAANALRPQGLSLPEACTAALVGALLHCAFSVERLGSSMPRDETCSRFFFSPKLHHLLFFGVFWQSLF